MQQIQYFKSAWGDIKNSPGWFGKMCLLALISFIPVFGPLVMLGYLYGWAREIAWGTHEPMPTRIFGNEDGKLYRRGWFILVLMFVAALVPSIVMGIGSGMQGAGVWGVAVNSHSVASSLASGIGLLIYLVGLVGVFFLGILAWIGAMRISIYDRLSAGFQLGKVWKMFRRDTGGIMRVFGMYLLVGLIVSIVVSIVVFVLMFVVVFVGVAGLVASGYSVSMLQHMTSAQAVGLFAQFIASAGVVGFLAMILAAFLAYLANAFVLTLVARAMGYWTMQFDVPRWRGQDDPMPFEASVAASVPPASPVPPVAPQPYYDGYGQSAQPAGQTWQAQQPAPVAPTAAPSVAAEPDLRENAPASCDEPAADESETAEGSFADPASEGSPDDADAKAAAAPDAPAPTIAPGELAGFTYGGTPAATSPVTPSGADPSAESTPDLLVVVPETPEVEDGAEDGR